MSDSDAPVDRPTYFSAYGFFAAVGFGIGVAIILGIALLAWIMGAPVSLSELAVPLLASGGLGGAIGAGFAGGVAVLGRGGGDGDGLPHWKAFAAGSLAAFLIPVLLIALLMVAAGVPTAELLELPLGWVEDAWWLLGVGGVGGVGLNQAARRAELPSGASGLDELPAEIDG